MGEFAGKIVEATVTLIGVFLILTNAGAFNTAVTAIGSVYVNAVRALQGAGGNSAMASV